MMVIMIFCNGIFRPLTAILSRLTGYENDVYQATLQKIDDMGVVLILTFDVFEPFDKIYRLAIWQDQVDSESWRMFKKFWQRFVKF